MRFRSLLRIVKTLTLAVFLAGLLSRAGLAEEEPVWIKAGRNGFIKDGRPFRFIGANAVNLIFYDDWDLNLEKAVQDAKESGISVLRMYIDLGWGKTEDFDRIFDIAAKRGIYIILTFTDCCCSRDSSCLEKYFKAHAPFCNITSRRSVKAFKKLIKEIIERKNSVNGKIYRDDAAILAWDIANELEYWHFAETDAHNWVDEISRYIKTLDKKHLVTAGIGIKDSGSGDFGPVYKIFNAPAVDFFSLHFYPSQESMDFNKPVLKEEEAKRLESLVKTFLPPGKPVILGEFGLSGSADLNAEARKKQPEFYNLIFRQIMDIAFKAGSSGAMFWGWGIPEEKDIPMWWSYEGHNKSDEKFCGFIKKYQIPEK